MALALMLMSGVLTWEGCLGCTFAWGESSGSVIVSIPG
jgi:hypothetical protein